jgi:hypothetical protein
MSGNATPTTLQPDITVRKTPYDIGGVPPYGYLQTPGYNTQLAPQLVPGFQLPAVQETALYERQDWQNAVDGLTNPPFIGIGSSTGAVPSWMKGDDGVHRILRGYIRRSYAHPITEPNLNEAQKNTNARLYFMYNPSEFTRQYVSYSALAGEATDDPNSALNLGQQVPALVTMDLTLFFDRQEEVARFANHPGVLVDLSVFDLLIGNDITTYDKPINLNGANGTDGSVPDTGAARGQMASLKPGLDIFVTIIVSPSITFEGKIWAAGVQFQKFSHRMTPTQMTITLTLQLNYTGPLLPQGVLNAADQAAAKAAKQNASDLTEIDPTQKAASAGAALQANYDGRVKAVRWAENWTADAKIKYTDSGPYAGTYGVYYWHSKIYNTMFDRCGGWQDDSGDNVQPPHQPQYFDCSSFCWRAWKVINWCKTLGLSDTCGDDSFHIRDAALRNNTQWSIDGVRFDQNTSQGGSVPGWSQAADKFNKWNPQNTPQPGPNTGDVVIRDGNGGHIAFIYDKVAEDTDPLKWQWRLLSSGTPDQAVTISKPITTSIILQGGSGYEAFDWIARPHPIPS